MGLNDGLHNRKANSSSPSFATAGKISPVKPFKDQWQFFLCHANSLIFYDQDCLMFLLFHPDLNRSTFGGIFTALETRLKIT